MARSTQHHTFFRRNGLIIVFAAMMVATMGFHAVAGWKVENEERQQREQPAQSLVAYVKSGPFQSSLFENWESEFLQMGLFVLLTVWLRQKGSSESRPLDPSQEKDKHYPAASRPWPVRRGGVWLKLYEHSLSASLFLLFAVSFTGHWIGSWKQYAEQALLRGEQPETFFDHLFSAQLWFESMQNWQSEFLSIIAIVYLSIYLREKDSPQSKPVDAPHSETGS